MYPQHFHVCAHVVILSLLHVSTKRHYYMSPQCALHKFFCRCNMSLQRDWNLKEQNGKIISIAYLRSYKADESNETGYPTVASTFYSLCFLEISKPIFCIASKHFYNYATLKHVIIQVFLITLKFKHVPFFFFPVLAFKSSISTSSNVFKSFCVLRRKHLLHGSQKCFTCASRKQNSHLTSECI